MADLSSIERRKLEQLLRMSGGYVLDATDRTFSEFFEEHTRRDIDAAVYRERGTSKANRMMRDTSVAELDALTATVDERDFETVAQHVREAIEKNQPEAALDRLHMFVIKYVRTLCEQRGVEVKAVSGAKRRMGAFL